MQLDKLDRRVGFALLFVAMMAFGVWYQSFFFPHYDLSGLLEGARMWGFDARYGREMWEINPPLIMYWLKMPVWIESLGLMSAYTAHTLLMSFLAWLSGVLIYRTLRVADIAPVRATFAMLSYLSILTIGTTEQFTQREIMLSLMSLPAMVMLSARLVKVGGAGVQRPDALEKVMLFLGGVGFLLKPHYTLIYWGAIGLCLVLRRDYLKQVFVPVALAFAASVLYAVVLWQTGWIAFYLEQRPVYSIVGPGGGQLNRNLMFFFYSLPLVYVLVMSVIPQAKALRQEQAFIAMLGLGGLLCFGGALIQNKAFSYHFFPLFACVFLVAALGLTIAETVFWKKALRLCLCVLAYTGVLQIQIEVWGRVVPLVAHADVIPKDLYQTMKRYAGQPVIPVSYDMTSALFIAEELKMPRPMRYFGLWPMAYVYAKQKMGSPEDVQQANDKLYELGGQIAEDIVRAKYPLVMLQMQIADGRRPFDYPVLFSSNPLFKDVWSRYHYVTSADGWNFYEAQLAKSSP